jgi:hypothetical protein
MTDAEVLAATTNPRLRDLLTPGPNYRPEYWPLARRLAGAEPPEERPAAAVSAAAQAVAACEHRTSRGCCQPAVCAAGRGNLHGGTRASLRHCRACVSGGEGPR